MDFRGRSIRGSRYKRAGGEIAARQSGFRKKTQLKPQVASCLTAGWAGGAPLSFPGPSFPRQDLTGSFKAGGTGAALPVSRHVAQGGTPRAEPPRAAPLVASIRFKAGTRAAAFLINLLDGFIKGFAEKPGYRGWTAWGCEAASRRPS